jgi:hypothetical protein
MVVRPGSAAAGTAEKSVTCVAASAGNPAKKEKPITAAQVEKRRDFTTLS